MVRSRNAIMVLVCAASMQTAHARSTDTAALDIARVIGGAAASGAAFIGAEAILHGIGKFIFEGELLDWDDLTTHGKEYYMLRRAFVVLGAAIGLGSTTYGRTLSAEWSLCWWRSKDLVAITMAEYSNDAQLINRLERYYLSSPFPLITAKVELAHKINALAYAANAIEDALNDIAQDSARAQSLRARLTEIYAMHTCVARAAMIVENDPRLPAMLEAQNRRNEANAQMLAANAKMIAALTPNRR